MLFLAHKNVKYIRCGLCTEKFGEPYAKAQTITSICQNLGNPVQSYLCTSRPSSRAAVSKPVGMRAASYIMEFKW